MRELLRQSFEGTLPVDEANAYGWGFSSPHRSRRERAG
jgi:hypothetical protein